LDRRNIIVRADTIRTELLSHLVTGATLVSDTARVGITAQSELNDNLYISRLADVFFNVPRGKFFAKVPTEYLSWNELSGIRAVRGAQDGQVDMNVPTLFFEQKLGAGAAYGTLESARLMGGIGFEKEGQTLWFNNMLPGSYPKVLITYIPTLAALTELDIMPCSGEFTAMLMDKTKAAFGFKRSIPEDKTADNASE
jgi:hypothetical protein